MSKMSLRDGHFLNQNQNSDLMIAVQHFVIEKDHDFIGFWFKDLVELCRLINNLFLVAIVLYWFACFFY